MGGNYKAVSENTKSKALKMAELLKRYGDEILDANELSKYKDANTAFEITQTILNAVNYYTYNGGTKDHYDIIINASTDYGKYKEYVNSPNGFTFNKDLFKLIDFEDIEKLLSALKSIDNSKVKSSKPIEVSV